MRGAGWGDPDALAGLRSVPAGDSGGEREAIRIAGEVDEHVVSVVADQQDGRGAGVGLGAGVEPQVLGPQQDLAQPAEFASRATSSRGASSTAAMAAPTPTMTWRRSQRRCARMFSKAADAIAQISPASWRSSLAISPVPRLTGLNEFGW